MEKLIVRNFGPIKDAELDLTKFVVFIGDTSTGKSVLAKLISIFRDSLYSLTVNFSESADPKKYQFNLEFDEQLANLNIAFDYKKSEIYYSNTYLLITIKNGIVSYEIIRNDKYVNLFNIGDYADFVLFNDLQPEDRYLRDVIDIKKIHSTLKDHRQFEYVNQKKPSYFPAERILISIVGSSLAGLWANNVALPAYFKEFAAKFEIAKGYKNDFDYKAFGFRYYYENNMDMVQIGKKKFELTKMSSGIQSLIPLLLTFDREVKGNRTLVIEEPELNLFPTKQKTLIEYMVSSVNNSIIEKYKQTNLVITTHSPYILTCLNTLILAKNVANEKPYLKNKINEILPEDTWIDYNDIQVYEVKKGKVNALKNKEFLSIETNIIDEVSGVISDEFDKLLDLRYEE